MRSRVGLSLSSKAKLSFAGRGTLPSVNHDLLVATCLWVPYDLGASCKEGLFALSLICTNSYRFGDWYVYSNQVQSTLMMYGS